MKLQTKIWLGLSAVVVAIMAIDMTISYRLVERDIRTELDHDAHIVRALLMSTRRVYHQQFIASELPVNEKTVGFLPAHALSRISADFPTWIDTQLTFNNVTDRPRNPRNAADRHELAAMEWFRANPKATERTVEIEDDQGRAFYHFTAPIWIEAYCLGCHGDPQGAPTSIRDNYADAYGYQLGELRGVMSIKLPMDELRGRALGIWWQKSAGHLVGYALLLALLGVLLKRMVVAPLKTLAGVARQIETGDLAARAPVRGSDEVAELSGRLNDMAAAIARHDEQLALINRIYSALSETNQTIVRENSEPVLLRRICEIAVTFGGLRMAWLARRNPETGRLVVAETYGKGVEYVDGMSISIEPSAIESTGPTATAWRTGQPVVIQDYLSDPRTALWRERAATFGWRSAAAYPIRRGGAVHLVLNIYHLDAHAFDPQIQDLLAEMATDIGYALDRIDLLAEQRRVHAALAESEAKYRSVITASTDGFCMIDREGWIREVNDAYAALTGYSSADLRTMNLVDLAPGPSPDEMRYHMARAMDTGSAVFEIRHRTRAGGLRPVEISMTPDALHSEGFAVFVRDLSTRKEAEARIQRLAHFDTLTGLPNRDLLADLARQAIAHASREASPLCLVYLDIDHFKNINDTLGHRIGDMLLVAIGERLRQLLRAEDVIGRLGGDEFLLILPGADAAGAAHLAEKLIAANGEPFPVEGHELLAAPTLGIAVFPTDGEDFESLLKKADTAANQAKRDGRGGYRFYTPAMQARSERSLALEGALRRALARNELLLHYQPQVDLQHGTIVGAEALLRWQHPDFGMVSPAEFIPLAESTGLIVPIGEWVIATALQQLKTWQAAQLPINLVAVNLSAVQFRQPSLPQSVSRLLADAGLPPRCLELELTESIAMESPEAAIAMIDALHDQGVHIAIDDFGTGYSSLSYLRRLRLDKLKIDQSFVRELADSEQDHAIVRAIISLAETLNFRTIAEGVEEPRQLAILRQCRCQEVQGYLFSRPLAPDALAEWLRNWTPERAWK